MEVCRVTKEAGYLMRVIVADLARVDAFCRTLTLLIGAPRS